MEVTDFKSEVSFGLRESFVVVVASEAAERINTM